MHMKNPDVLLYWIHMWCLCSPVQFRFCVVFFPNSLMCSGFFITVKIAFNVEGIFLIICCIRPLQCVVVRLFNQTIVVWRGINEGRVLPMW